MRNRRDDFRGSMGMGRDEDRDRDRDRDREGDRDRDRDRTWSRDQDMGGSHWSGASGRGGYGEGGYGGGWGGQREHSGMNMYGRGQEDRESRQWGRDRDRYGDDFGGRSFGARDDDRMSDRDRGFDRDMERDMRGFDRDYDDRPRNLGAHDYETRHFGMGRGRSGMEEGSWRSEMSGRGIGGRIAGERGEQDFGGGIGDRGYRGREMGWGGGERGGWSGDRGGWSGDRAGWMGSSGRVREGQGGYGGSTSYAAFQGSRGIGGYGGGGMMGRQSPYDTFGGRGGRSMEGLRGEGWGQRMGGSDLGFSYGEHEGSDDLESRGPHYGKGPKGYKRSTDRIREDVCDAIARQGHIDASDVEVKVEDGGTVVLSGTVGERRDKRMLEQMVERLHGVDEVRNELRLRRDEQAQTRGQTSTQATGSQQNGDQGRQSQHPNGKTARV